MVDGLKEKNLLKSLSQIVNYTLKAALK